MTTVMNSQYRDFTTTVEAHTEGANPALLASNAAVLQQEMDWFYRVLETRLQLYFENDCEYADVSEIEPPAMPSETSEYAQLVNQYQMNFDERLILILTLIPNLQPQLLNLLLINDPMIGKPYIEFGGWRGNTHGGFLPTAETAAFILAGKAVRRRLAVFSILQHDHFLIRDGILEQLPGNAQESYLTAPLSISYEYFYKLTIGRIEKPDYSVHFPAKLLNTPLQWADLVLPKKVRDDIEHIQVWLQQAAFITHSMGLEKSIKPGYRALFFGPPGTGKTLTASLLGKQAGMDVYRIDLSAVVSKYIGETEKNLETIFRQAESRQWVLFFDEADALFGKRSETQSSNDRHANQEVAYLLQRIEDFPGVVILATNLKSNIDEAFLRRFQSVVYFPMPDRQDRLKLWQKALEGSPYLADDVDCYELASEFELAGGAIVNVIRYAAIAALKHGQKQIRQQDLFDGIQKEQRKHGKIIG